ncbi:putative candidate secreted effector protein [Blumeria hordei DH14]|uniref:Putative candidate secreted effector protein n=1 Tax=Blumeria graminis f. sp. hordei (strain DH14) TaxID=546991 RepID=N1JPG4_BLUG1|nr:putative candidate secreted effector protein [Blumeria hordei DH14]
MRFSRMAIIFHSASFCTTSLAAQYSRHINEELKVFHCNNDIHQEEYSRTPHYKIQDPDTIQGLNEELSYLVADTYDTRTVQFYDQDNGDYEYFNLSEICDRYQEQDGTVVIEHILVNDRQGRACAMMMIKTVIPFTNWDGQSPQRYYSLCAVGSG